MKYPMLEELPTMRYTIEDFRGYNHNLRIADGEFYDMQNMTSSYYPVLSPRRKRGVYASPDNAQGLIAKDALCYIDGSHFVMNEYRIDMGLSVAEEDCPKTLVSMGAYVIILPDKKYINTADMTDYGNIEASYAARSDVTFSLCTVDGAEYTGAIVTPTEPESPNNLDMWIDTSSVPHTLKKYSSTSAVWVAIPTTYIKISATGIGAAFEQYDGVTISGITAENVQDLNTSAVVWSRGDDYIVVVGMLDMTTTQSVEDGVIKVERKMPNLDFVIESENRLWGCRYGVATNGDVVNEIYSCKLGDFKNWNCFMGLSTDSYVASCGTDGRFTGAITHLGYPLFFKEKYLHKVYGNFPSNFQIQTTACRGVQKGCERSLDIVNEVLYYKSRSGVCAYDGSLPAEASSQFGEEMYSDAVACAHHNKYYISMKDSANEYHLFVLDTAKGMWHKEDNTQVYDFCSCREELYYIDKADGKIKTIFGSGTTDTDPVSWMVETGVIGTDSPDKKYVSRLSVRMALDIGTKVSLSVEYDSGGEWHHLFSMTGTKLQSFVVPVRPRRSDHMRLRIEGVGSAKIYSITKTVEEGSDI